MPASFSADSFPLSSDSRTAGASPYCLPPLLGKFDTTRCEDSFFLVLIYKFHSDFFRNCPLSGYILANGSSVLHPQNVAGHPVLLNMSPKKPRPFQLCLTDTLISLFFQCLCHFGFQCFQLVAY